MLSILCIVLFSSCLMNLSSPAEIQSNSEWFESVFNGRNPVFRKDYTLDQTKRGWFKLHRVPAKWHDARKRCKLEGAELASPWNTDMLRAMLSKMTCDIDVFIGVHSIFSYGDYYSIDGVSVEEMPVTWSHRLSPDEDKRCVVLSNNETIYNEDCYATQYPYICYKRNDFIPVTECGFHESGYTLNPVTETCYKIHPNGSSWSDAFKTCSAEGGHLVVINSDEELNAVVQLIPQVEDTHPTIRDINIAELLKEAASYNDRRTIFIGVIDWENNGEWVTIHGEDLKSSGFPKWRQNKEDSSNVSRFCGALRYPGVLSAVSCITTAFPFVCEKQPYFKIKLL